MTKTLAAPLIRNLTQEEREDAIDSIHSWMEFPDDASLIGSYPQVFQAEGQALSLGAFFAGKLSSHTAYRRVNLRASNGFIKATLVGDVATAPEHRGERLASRILEKLASSEQAAGQDCILLWSDLWEFYARLGYAPAGVQAELKMKINITQDCPGVRPAAIADLSAILELHEQKPWRVKRDLSELSLLMSVQNLDCMVLTEDSRILAYACHGKGLDLQGWWHELGGSDQALQKLIPAAMSQLRQKEAVLILPPYRHALITKLSGLYEELREGIVALCKPLSSRGLCDFFVDGLDSI